MRYKPLWLIEQIDSKGDIIESKLMTKNIPVDPEKGLHSTGIFTKKEQTALGTDLYGLTNLKKIYRKAYGETEALLDRLVESWYFTNMLRRLQMKKRMRNHENNKEFGDE